MKKDLFRLLQLGIAIIAIYVVTHFFGGFGTIYESEVTATAYMNVHLEVRYLNGEKALINTAVVEATRHYFTQNRGWYQINSGCYLTLPGDLASHFFQQDMTKIEINIMADQIVRRANRILKDFGGGPFRFVFTPAQVRGDCNQNDVFATVYLSMEGGERWGPGFLRANHELSDQEENAYIYIPVKFYDDVLSIAESSNGNRISFKYPEIEILGGYTVLSGDPNNTGEWLNSQLPFLRRVYLSENLQRVDFSGLVNEKALIQGFVYK